MAKDTHITDVLFRKYKKTNEILALFPHVVESNGFVTCYQHVGQHDTADYKYCVTTLTVPATPEEYADLKKELEDSIGYNLNVVKRRNWNKYINQVNKNK